MLRRLVSLALCLAPPRVAAQNPPVLIREERIPVFLSGSPSSLATWAGDSTIALADVLEQRVLLIDIASGKVRAGAGRAGEGPGEYRGVNPPVRGPDGSFLVVDSRLRRATILSESLEPRRTVALPVVVNSVLGWTGTGLFCTWYDFTRRMAPVLGLLRFGPAPADRADPIPLVWLDSLFGSIRREPFSLPPIVTAAIGKGGHTFLARVDQYRILKLDPRGSTSATMQRDDLPVERYSAQEIEEQAGRLRGASPAPISSAAAARVRDVLTGMPKPFFSMNALSEDGQGRLWAITARSERDSTEVDVFSPQGRFLGTVRLRGQVRSLAWNGSRAVAVVERSEGEEGLGVVDYYRVR